MEPLHVILSLLLALRWITPDAATTSHRFKIVFLSVSQQFCVRLCLCLLVVGDLSKDVSVIDGVVSSLCPGKDHGQAEASTVAADTSG
jgi:hypothetical protein